MNKPVLILTEYVLLDMDRTHSECECTVSTYYNVSIDGAKGVNMVWG